MTTPNVPQGEFELAFNDQNSFRREAFRQRILHVLEEEIRTGLNAASVLERDAEITYIPMNAAHFVLNDKKKSAVISDNEGKPIKLTNGDQKIYPAEFYCKSVFTIGEREIAAGKIPGFGAIVSHMAGEIAAEQDKAYTSAMRLIRSSKKSSTVHLGIRREVQAKFIDRYSQARMESGFFAMRVIGLVVLA